MNNFENCGYYTDGECNICGMGTDGEDTFCKYCKDNPNCYYKQLAELKAENERLKEEIKEVKKYQYKQEYLDKEIEIRDNLSEKFRKEALSWANIANDYQKDKTKLEQTLQEIKTIAEELLEKGLEPQSVEHQLRLRGKRELASIILDLIYKAESEG